MKIAEEISWFRVDDCIYPKGGVLGPRMQTSLQLFYVYRGDCRISIDGQTRQVGPNRITLLMPDHVEQFVFSKTAQTHHGFCSAFGVTLSAQQKADYQTLTGVFPLSRKVRELTDWAKTVNRNDHPPAQNLYDQIARLLFYEFFNITGHPAKHRPLPEAVLRARALADLDFSSPLKLADLARAACITPTHLTRLFRQHLDTTPIEYLWKVRTENGAQMLVETGLSISEISYQCGFSAPYHFARRFKTAYKQTPRAFRTFHWEKQTGT